MKFLYLKENQLKENYNYNDSFFEFFGSNYLNFDFYNSFIKNRKYISKTRLGIVKKIKDSSSNRNKNKELIKQYISISQKKGKANSFLKSLNISTENIFYVLGNESEEFKRYKNYESYHYLFNSVYYYSDISNIVNISIKDLESIFEIKTIKNGKRVKSPNKYSHEIVYIPKKKRFKYIIRALSFYKESFKNYNLWERVFWSFLLSIINKNNSFLKKRRDYIYSKSIKFFKIKKNK